MSPEPDERKPDERDIERAVEALSRGEECDLPTEAQPQSHEDKLLDRRTSKAQSDDTLEWITSLLK